MQLFGEIQFIVCIIAWFKKKRSTEATLCKFISSVHSYLNRIYFVAGGFIDISKALDSFNHKILFNKLEGIGIRGPSAKLFRS